jgi:hypothetical protein
MLYLALFDAHEHIFVSHVTGEEGLTELVLYPSVLKGYVNRKHIPPHFMGIDAGWDAPYWGMAVGPLPLKWTCLLLLSSKISHFLARQETKYLRYSSHFMLIRISVRFNLRKIRNFS